MELALGGRFLRIEHSQLLILLLDLAYVLHPLELLLLVRVEASCDLRAFCSLLPVLVFQTGNFCFLLVDHFHDERLVCLSLIFCLLQYRVGLL